MSEGAVRMVLAIILRGATAAGVIAAVDEIFALPAQYSVPQCLFIILSSLAWILLCWWVVGRICWRHPSQ